MKEPRIIKGGLAVDDRGQLTFANEFDFAGVKRFYMVENHRNGFVRAWHGHKKEAKYMTVIHGSALIAAVEIDNWDKPSKDLKVHRHVLSARAPSLFYIPEGFANGSMSLEEGTKILIFSTTSLQDSLGDDIRFESRYWNPWNVEER